MSQLQLSLTDDEIQNLKHCAHTVNRTVDSLIKEYLAHLLAGGEPVTGETNDLPRSKEVAELVMDGKSFD